MLVCVYLRILCCRVPLRGDWTRRSNGEYDGGNEPSRKCVRMSLPSNLKFVSTKIKGSSEITGLMSWCKFELTYTEDRIQIGLNL